MGSSFDKKNTQNEIETCEDGRKNFVETETFFFSKSSEVIFK